MKAVEIQQFGLKNLALVDRNDPTPGKGEVLVRMRAVSLNYRDYLTIEGQYNPRYKLPMIPCSDGAGEVVAVGEGVSEFKKGDRVLGVFAADWVSGVATHRMIRTTLGGPLDGTLTELRVFPENGLVPMPEHLSYEEGATLPCAALTAWSALAVEGRINPGDVVVVQGTGGVSIFALQIAKLFGAKVIATSSSDEKLEKAKELGADYTINYRTKPEWGKEVRRITHNVGADHIIEVGGAGTLTQSSRAIKAFGQISLIGILGGTSGDFNLLPILMQNVKIQGILVGSKTSFESMNKAIDAHKLKPVIDKTFAFGEYREAIEYLRDGKHFGKVCISIG